MAASKYHNQKIVIHGMTFDSKKEADHYLVLRDAERRGLIRNLRRQVKFVLIPAQYIEENGKRSCAERETSYIADFVYEKNGETIVEDVKGYRDPSSAAYALFVVKRKLMLQNHNIRVREV